VQYPFERINLPSNGQCYTNSLSSGKVNLYPFTAKHEDILCSPGLCKDFTHFDILLQDIIQNKDIGNINDLLQVDVEGIMLASKMLSYGPNQPSRLECPHCGESNEYIVNLSNFRPIEATIPKNKVYHYNNYTIHFGLPTYGLFKTCETPTQLTRKLINEIVDENGNSIDIDIFISNKFLYKDYKRFKQFLTNCFPHITPEIKISCLSCDSDIKIPFRFDRNFFGMDGSYKIGLHKEIFAILYSSNGGFSHNDIYNMPINLRKMYTSELINTKEKEKEQSRQTEDAPRTPMAKPPISK
jgi:hypothetical protein